MTGNFSEESGVLYTYGRYLLGGGTPDGFLDLTPDDVQAMYTVALGDQMKQANRIIEGIARMFGAEKT